MKMNKTWIYALSDKSGIRYVGKSKHPYKRYKEHITLAKYHKNYKDKWIISLLKNNEKPSLKILFCCPSIFSNYLEIVTIFIFKKLKYNLTNGTRGGDFYYDRTGMRVSDEERLRMIEYNGKSKKVIQMNLNGDIIQEWISMRQAAEYYGINRSHICYCCKGDRKTIGGYRWKYSIQQR